jgi:hypothetical protein
MNSKQKCWYTKKSTHHNNKIYYVNNESGISHWGKPLDKESEILPAGWEHHISTSGKSFYYNIHENVARWEKPTEKDKLPVPKGWEEMRSRKCNNVYYMNSEIGKTQWEHPGIPSRGKVDNFIQARHGRNDTSSSDSSFRSLDQEFPYYGLKDFRSSPDTSFRSAPSSPESSYRSVPSPESSFRSAPSPDTSYESLTETYEHLGLPRVQYYGASEAQQMADQLRFENRGFGTSTEVEHEPNNQKDEKNIGIPYPRGTRDPISDKSLKKMKSQNIRSVNPYAYAHAVRGIPRTEKDEILSDYYDL